MMSVSTDMKVGNVIVQTTQNRGLPQKRLPRDAWIRLFR